MPSLSGWGWNLRQPYISPDALLGLPLYVYEWELVVLCEGIWHRSQQKQEIIRFRDHHMCELGTVSSHTNSHIQEITFCALPERLKKMQVMREENLQSLCIIIKSAIWWKLNMQCTKYLWECKCACALAVWIKCEWHGHMLLWALSTRMHAHGIDSLVHTSVQTSQLKTHSNALMICTLYLSAFIT